MVQLDPVGGQAFAVYNGIVAGVDANQPTVWTNNGTTTIHLRLPPGYSTGTNATYAIWGNQVGAFAFNNNDQADHAVLWNGTGSPPVDLGAFSQVNAIYNGVQAGASGNAALWRGTAASLISLSPPGATFNSRATGIWGSEVSGTWYRSPTGSDPHAALWTSLDSSGFVDLTQPSFIKSDALAVSRGQVAGWAIIVNAGKHAGFWTNSAASFQDLAPSGTTASELFGTNGTQQVGDVSLLPGGGSLPVDSHAAVWSGTAASYEMLPSPQGSNYSIAFAIDGRGDIVGEAGTQRAGTIGNIVPVMWLPHRLPGDANFDGTVNFSDLLILSQHYGQSGEWVDGDFNGGGTVDFADLLTLAQNYGKTQSADQLYAATSLSSNPLPEPTDIVLLSIGWASMLRYRGLGAAQA